MKLLQLIFVALGLYSMAIGHIGAALLAAVMVVFLLCAERIFKEQDRQWAADPRRAATPSTTSNDLKTYECEAARNDSYP